MVKKITRLFVAAFLLALTLVSASQSQYYSDLGNITSDSSVYSCWPSCLAYINLTINSTGPYANDNLSTSLNNSAGASAVEFAIYWLNETGLWELQGVNDSFINNSNLNLTTGVHQFRINITLSSAFSTKWNVSFNVNGTDYVLDPYLDSIDLNSPANYNITSDQTPDFNFTLFSNSATTQSCTLYTRINDTGSWVVLGSNSSTINGTSTVITASYMNEANYTWKVTCNVTEDSDSRWIYIDDISTPSISSLSAAASSTTTTITWTTSENANSSVHYGTTISLGDVANYAPTNRQSHTIQLTDLDYATTYYYNATSCDSGANCATSSGTFTTSSYSAPSSGGGSVQTQAKTRTWSRLAAGESGSWSLNSKDLAIKQINITVINESKSIKLSVSRILTLYSSMPQKSGELYRYLKIEAEKINGLNRSSIMLQIEKTWMQNNSLEKADISLFKFDNSSDQWKKLNTTFESEDSTYYFFTSNVESFSYFAIAGEKIPTTPPTTTTNQTTTPSNASSGDNAGSTTSDDEGTSWTGVIIMGIIIAVVVIGIVVFIIYSQLFKKRKK